ncbi:MAG TPA: hypothetical protein VK557_00300 [Pyrinomonadaceae bacterium]|nr:hypothetical protein [Pyrinomonadaceae bacterium]
MGKSLEQSIRAAAVKNLASKSTAQILREFKDQGITSLEDLAKNIVTSAKGAGASAAFDDEIFGVCYKFTTYRPHFGTKDITNVINVVKNTTAFGD